MMSARRAWRLAAVLGTIPALSGCVAAVIPVIAAGAVTKSTVDRNDRRQDAPAPAPTQTPREQTAGGPVPVPAADGRVPVFAGEGAARAQLGQPAPAFKALPDWTPPGGQTATVQTPPAVQPVPVQKPVVASAAPAPKVTPAPKPAPVVQAQVAAAPVVKPQPVLAVAAPKPAPESAELPATSEAPAPAPQPQVRPAPAPAPELAAVTPPPAPAKPARSIAMAQAPVPYTARSSGYLGFTAYTISHANAPDAGAVVGVVDVMSPLAAPRRPQCGGQAPAVILDLDPGLSVFNPDAPETQPGLPDALAALRSAGVTVMWASALPIEQAEKVHAALARTGLDPNRTDRLLLLNGKGDRKQARRASASRNWCVIAMAGDRRGDFDEIFDYLRDPEATIPADALMGDGWFIAPAPMP